MSFPVTAYPDDSKPLLHEVLASDMPLLQLWGCRDWSGLAEQSEERRALIFTVSQPGNHPHNWNNIISAILPQCSAFVAALTGKETVLKKEELVLAREPITSPDTSIITSPTRLRSMALKSPARTVNPVTEQPAPGLNDKIQLKIQDVSYIIIIQVVIDIFNTLFFVMTFSS
jgi:Nucleoporin protein Ndc1-Nup